MVGLVEEAGGIVLAVDVDELDAQLMQNGNRHQTAVDPADVLAVQMDFALDDGFGVVLDAVFCKPGQFRHAREHRPDGGFGGAGTDHVAVGALTQDGRNGVDDDGLTRTGLTGEDVEAPVKGNVRTFDDRNIFNMQKTQHGSSLLFAFVIWFRQSGA